MKVVKVFIGKFFEVLIRVQVDWVPELRVAMVQIINGIQVHVFFVPAEKRPPNTDV